MNRIRRNKRLDSAPLYILLIFLTLTALGGGSSRADVPSLLFLRPVAILCLICLAIFAPRFDFRPIRVPLWLLAAFALVIALQLVPLPPGTWQALPGHMRFTQAATLAGMAQPWRPISLQPDLTMSSLLALLSPLVVLVGFAALPKVERPILVTFLAAMLVVTTLWGILQMTSMGTGAQLYRLSNIGQPLGLFANRNHQAALLAAGFPILRLWVLLGPRIDTADAKRRTLAYTRLLGAVAVAMIMLFTLVLTGSRMGLLLGVIGMVGALIIAPIRLPFATGRRQTLFRLALVIVPIVLLAIMIVFGRALALDRLFSSDLVSGEQRIAFAPITFALARAFLPLGSGFGTFDAVFRIDEPDSALKPSYFNHAHNDLVELIIVGGIPAAILLVGLALWLLRRLPPLFRKPERGAQTDRWFARTGMIVITILFVASTTDYPLRTPLLAAVFGLMICWIASGRSTQDAVQATVLEEGKLYHRERVD